MIVKEFVDTGENIELQPVADYAESCWGWNDVKKSLDFFVERIEEKLQNDPRL